MRAWPWLALLLLAGCTAPTADPDTRAPGPGPPSDVPGAADDPDPNPDLPYILPLWNGTLAAAAPGGSGHATFVAPAKGYVELFVNTNGPVRAVGDVHIRFEAPDGTETVYVAGMFAQDDDQGLAPPEASRTDWRLRIPIQGGTWTLHWRVDGDLRLPLFVEAL